MNSKPTMTIPTFLQKSIEQPEKKTELVRNVVPENFMNPPIIEEEEDSLIELECDKADKVVGDISPLEKDTIIRNIRAMDKSQLEIVLDNIPIEMVYNRLGKELERNKAFIHSMKNAMSLVDSDGEH